MKMTTIGGLALLALGAMCGGAQASQMDELKSGKVQCYSPNPATHHCQAMSSYVFGGGAIGNPSQILLAPAPLTVLNMNTPATFKDPDTSCGIVRKADIDAATITVDGVPVDATRADPVKAQLWAFFGPYDGQELCTGFVPDGDGYKTVSTRNGQPDPMPPVSHVILVGPGDGWSVGP